MWIGSLLGFGLGGFAVLVIRGRWGRRDRRGDAEGGVGGAAFGDERAVGNRLVGLGDGDDDLGGGAEVREIVAGEPEVVVLGLALGVHHVVDFGSARVIARPGQPLAVAAGLDGGVVHGEGERVAVGEVAAELDGEFLGLGILVSWEKEGAGLPLTRMLEKVSPGPASRVIWSRGTAMESSQMVAVAVNSCLAMSGTVHLGLEVVVVEERVGGPNALVASGFGVDAGVGGAGRGVGLLGGSFAGGAAAGSLAGDAGVSICPKAGMAATASAQPSERKAIGQRARRGVGGMCRLSRMRFSRAAWGARGQEGEPGSVPRWVGACAWRIP